MPAGSARKYLQINRSSCKHKRSLNQKIHKHNVERNRNATRVANQIRSDTQHMSQNRSPDTLWLLKPALPAVKKTRSTASARLQTFTAAHASLDGLRAFRPHAAVIAYASCTRP